MNFDMTGFSHAVAEADETDFVETLDAINRSMMFTELTSTAHNALNLMDGHKVLDVGCGTGDALKPIIAAVGPTGEVHAVDSSRSMLAELEKRFSGLDVPPSVHLSRAESLPFKTSTFDCVRCERVLIYSSAPTDAISEMVRVLRPGGRVVLAEPDLSTSIPSSTQSTLTTRIIRFSQDDHGSSGIARNCHLHLASCGIEDIAISTVVSTLRDFGTWADAFRIDAMLERQINDGNISASEASAWLDEMKALGQQGLFFWSVTSFVVSGSKPSQ